MSEKGRGKPVDKLDRACKIYKECIQCASAEFGEECKPEMKTYSFEAKSSGRVICTNQRSSCGRALCECDKYFAKLHSFEYESFNPNFSSIKQVDQLGDDSSSVWDAQSSCEVRTSYRTSSVADAERSGSRSCCSGGQKIMPYLMFNSQT
jgi:hypothetical protein